MNSKNSEVKQQEDGIEPFQISYTKFTSPGTKDNIRGKLLDLKQTLDEFYRIANNIRMEKP